MSMIPGGGSNLTSSINSLASNALVLKGLEVVAGSQTTPQKEGTTPNNGTVNFSGSQPKSATCTHRSPQSQGQLPDAKSASRESVEGGKQNNLLQQLLSVLGLKLLLSKLFPGEQKSQVAGNSPDQAANPQQSGIPGGGNILQQLLQSIVQSVINQFKEALGLSTEKSGKNETATPSSQCTSQSPVGKEPGTQSAANSQNASSTGGKEGGLLKNFLALIGLQSVLPSLLGGGNDQGQKQA